MAVTVTDRPNADEARVRVEYVYSDHNEVQERSPEKRRHALEDRQH